MATGHYRHGILLAPLTAERIVDLLPGAGARPARLDPLFAPFRPDRFPAACRSPAGSDGGGTSAGGA